ncbi:hypothetical protein Hanom_Chr11g00975911 [Helianthus anomalus]
MLGSRGFIVISLLYSQAMTQQKLSFLSDERHGLGETVKWLKKLNMSACYLALFVCLFGGWGSLLN